MEELVIRPGDVIASKYRVEKILGAGGMGVVVAARHVALGSLVAIKLMQPRAMSVRGAVDRFLREGQAAAALSSKHVAKVLDVGQLDTGTPFMIMEHLSGADLATIVAKKGAIPLADAAEYLLQACDGIGEAHAKGIVHRDLKPANLFLETEPDGTPLVKVLDFGIAKIAGEQGLTGTSQGMGSGGYMSPEQMSSAKKVDHRADIWALGVTFYELVTGQRPFHAESLEQFVTAVIWGQPTPVATHRADLPADVEAVIFRCLEKNPDNRFSTVAHFAQRLAAWAPPRAHVYVNRVAIVLGVGAPSLAQTSPGMQAPSAHPSPAVATAFGPAPPIAVASAAPSGARGAEAPSASVQAGAQSPSVPVPVQASASPAVATSPGAPHALAVSQAGVPTAIGPGPAHPLSVSQAPSDAVSGPSASVVSAGARDSGVARTEVMTGVVPTAAPPIPQARSRAALFVVAAVALVALGGGGMWLATRPSATASTDVAPGPATTATATLGATSSGAAAVAEQPTSTASAASTGASATATVAVSADPSATARSGGGAKSPAGSKVGSPKATASAVATVTPTTEPISPNRGIGGPRQ